MTKNRRRRIIIQSVIVALVLTTAWIGVLVGLQMLKSSTYHFRAETENVLVSIRDGRAGDVYDDASQRFRDTMTLETFEDLTTRINQKLGPFKKLLATYDPVINKGPQGKTGYVTVSLEFEKCKTTGSFSYQQVDGKWLLLGLDIEIPEVLGAEEGAGKPNYEFQQARKEAPAEVLALIEDILNKIEDGKAGEVYDQASEKFKEAVHTKQRFLDLVAAERKQLGHFYRILYITHSWSNRENLQNKANVVCVLEYRKGEPGAPTEPGEAAATTKTEARFEFDRTEGGPWRLLKFKVVLPEPVVPRIPQHDPE